MGASTSAISSTVRAAGPAMAAECFATKDATKRKSSEYSSAGFKDLTCSQIGQVLAWICDPSRELQHSQTHGHAVLSSEKTHVSTALPSVLHLVKIITCTCRMLYSKLGENENIWYALNRFQFRVDPKSHKQHHHWPNVSSPRQLHSILSVYAPLEGFYVCATPFPFGLLFVLRFRDGQFVAELVSLGKIIDQTDGDDISSAKLSVDERTQIMSVSFADGKHPQTTFCGCAALAHHGAAELLRIMASANRIMAEINAGAHWTHPTIASSLHPFLSRPGTLIVQVDATTNMTDTPESVEDAWNPHRPSKNPAQLLMSLLSTKYESEMALAYLYGPAAVKGFVPKPDMPVIRPGLYVGSYGEMAI